MCRFKAADFVTVSDIAYVNAAPVKNLQGSELYKNYTNLNYDWYSLDLSQIEAPIFGVTMDGQKTYLFLWNP